MRGVWVPAVPALGVLLLSGLLARSGRSGPALVLLGVNAVAAAVFAWDKHAAARGRWRVSEATLLGLSALGGWPGAASTMLALRHKTRKGRFLVLFGLIGAAWGLGLGLAWLWMKGTGGE